MDFLESIFIRPLKDLVVRNFGYFMRCRTYVEALEDEMLGLMSRRDDVKSLVHMAELHGKKVKTEVRLWLGKVLLLVGKTDRIRDDARKLLLRTGTEPTERWYRRMWAMYHLSKRADEAYMVASKLRENSFNKVEDESGQVRFKEVPSTPIIGRRALLAQLLDSVYDGRVGIVGVYGMAGVGKTALLNKFHNEFISKATDIDLVVYIEETSAYDTDTIQKIIGDRLGLSADWKGLKERAADLHNALCKMNFLLIFDAIWKPLDFLEIGIPVPAHGSKSKIIISSQNEQVCNGMDVKRKIKVDCLPHDEAWMLFLEKVGGAISGLNVEKQRHAMELVSRCGGLPHALVAVGRAMASKKTVEEWKHAITSLRIAPWQLFSLDTYLLKDLKSSYDNLSDNTLKICLLYCSMFPEGFSIPMEWITGYFIGEGFIDDDAYTGMDELYDKGHDLLGILKSTCLLERGDDDYHVKMHPMIRAMALWIASHGDTNDNRWIVWAEAGLEEAPPLGKWSGAGKISLIKNNIRNFQEKPHCPQLKTLILQQNPTSTICTGFFQFMASLRVLDLSHTFINELPSGMNVLASLQYLDLSYTKIRSLPKELEALVNLRLLLLSNLPLETIPNGLVSSLSALQVIHSDVCLGDPDGSSVVGINFTELECLNKLKALDITIRTSKSLQKLQQSHRLAGRTRNLYLKGCHGLSTIVLSSDEHWRNMNGLKCLWVANCNELKELLIDDNSSSKNAVASSGSSRVLPHPVPSVHHLPRNLYETWEINRNNEQPLLPNLHSMVLEGLKLARIVRRDGSMQHLSSLTIRQCDALEYLIVTEMQTSKRYRNATSTIEVFPNLRTLYLGELPNLKSLSTEMNLMAFPELTVLTIVDCPRLKMLKLDAKELKEIRCTKAWLNKLHWNDENIKSSLLPLFKY
ncbi:hypothetical protein LUZ60_011477 [Juncus effusus]|nr:hypothetical protein LUZ60_011477 [Juncus effusus]